MANLHPCVQTILTSLQRLSGNDIGDIFALLGNDTSVTWTVASGIPDNPLGNADTKNNPNTPFEATTRINPSYTATATNIAVARTLIHEALHAYLGRWGKINGINQNATMNALLDGYVKGTTFNQNDEHALMASIISRMADALQAYCNSNGILLQHERAEDLFWSGLRSTDGYARLTAARQDMISRENSAEQQNTNVSNPVAGGVDIQPQGTKACN